MEPPWEAVQEYEVQGTSRTSFNHTSICLTDNVSDASRQQHTFLRNNNLINDSILHSTNTHKTDNVTSHLSTCVFPDKVEYPLDETRAHLGPLHESNFGYVRAKQMPTNL